MSARPDALGGRPQVELVCELTGIDLEKITLAAEKEFPGEPSPASGVSSERAPDADALDARLKDGGGSIVDTMTSEEDEREIWCVEIHGDGLCQAFEIAL